MKYRLIMSGTCFEGSAHILTDNEVIKIHEFKTKNSFESLVDMHSELSSILGEENYVPDTHTNYWMNSTAIKDSRLNFKLLNENDNNIWESKEICDLEETPWVDLVPYEQLDAPTLAAYTASGNAELDAYPHDAKPNILLYYQELRGTLVSFTIETDTQPKPTDFAHTSRCLETPKYEIELVDKVFYKGQLLKREYEYEDYRGKNLTVELFTMKDVE
jgi:hypothetical protein